LLTSWQVEADADYSIRAERSRADSHVRINKAGKNLVALRTLRGGGVLHCAGKRYPLDSGTLLIFDFRSLESYRTSSDAWDFWWFEFRAIEPICLPVGQVMSESLAQRCRAAALLQAKLFQWWEQSGLQDAPQERNRQRIQHLIEAMHRNPEKPWTLNEMSRQAGMSISSLRNAFLRMTGKPPSKVRNSLRLAHAHEQLRRGDRTVAEVAGELGYCDPFHFSKAFKAEYGFPPKTVVRNLSFRA
jgi:AraC-like DNA-binding protein